MTAKALGEFEKIEVSPTQIDIRVSTRISEKYSLFQSWALIITLLQEKTRPVVSITPRAVLQERSSTMDFTPRLNIYIPPHTAHILQND